MITGEISGIEFASVVFKGNTQFTACTFDDMGMSKSTMHNVNLAESTIDDANLTRVAITDSNIDGMTIDGIPVKEALEMYRKNTPPGSRIDKRS